MDDKPVVTQDEQVNDQNFTYEDLHKESIQDIATNTEVPVEEKPAEEAKPPIEVEPPKEDVQEVIKKTAEETAQTLLEKQREEDQRKEEEKAKLTPQEDEYAKWEKQLWEKENRSPTYVEALNFVKEQAKNELKAEEDQATKQKQEEEAKVTEQRNTEKKVIENYVDMEFKKLIERGLLTDVKDPNNPSDQGIVERKELSKVWFETNQERLKKGEPEIMSATEIFYNHYKKPTAQPAGADAPVAGNKGSVKPPLSENNPGYTYAEIKNKPWSFFGKR